MLKRLNIKLRFGEWFMKSEKWQMENDNYKRKTKLLLKNEFLVWCLRNVF